MLYRLQHRWSHAWSRALFTFSTPFLNLMLLNLNIESHRMRPILLSFAVSKCVGVGALYLILQHHFLANQTCE